MKKSHRETKKFLSQVNDIDRRISIKLIEAEKHRMMALNIGNTIKEDRVQTTPTNVFENALISAREAEEEANELIEVLYQKRKEINNMICALQDEEVVDVLTAHYLCGKTFYEMADILHMSKSKVCYVYDRGIELFEKMYGDRYMIEEKLG